MKKIIVFLFFLVAAFVVATRLDVTSVENIFYYSYCDRPIHYRVDTVDPKFNLSRDNFLTDITQSAQIWDKAYGKNLFVYDPKGDLSINLIYDERQSLTNQISQLENTVQSEKQTLNPQISEYQKLSADFKQKLADLNSQIESWNSRGGAPPDEYKKLIQQQQDLQVQANNLNAMARSLNLSANQYNVQVNNLNQTIDTFNSALEQRPEEGIFKGPEDRIEIYFNISKQELVHTLAHELGHALGLGHVGNKVSIMYPKTGQSIAATNEDLAALNEACKKHSIFEIMGLKFAQIIAYYQKILNLAPAQ